MNPFPLRVTGPVMKLLPNPTAKPRTVTSDCGLTVCALERLRRSLERPGDGVPDALLEGLPDNNGAMGALDSDCGGHCPKTLHDATFLNAVLPFALGQARRHREPLSLVCVAIDRLHGVQELLGRDVADSLVRWVGETVLSLIRSSDVVARLDDDRMAAVLPRSCDLGALRVGEMICQKVAETRWLFADQPGMKITVSVGVATFPSSAENAFSLFEAADNALAQAQAHGRNQAVAAPRILAAPPVQGVVAADGD
ncbi:MAG: GGDEF domain-containing protein [Isosphaeraceae bacterium]